MMFLILMTAAVVTLVLYVRQVYTRFSRYGVKNFTPIPFLGTVARVTFRLQHLSDHLDALYKTFPNERFVGNYEFIAPAVMIRDVELVKKITVKDFEHFTDRRIYIDKKTERYLGGSLIVLTGQEWKDMRATLSPTFTGAKIRLMVEFMVEVGDHMIKAIKSKLQASNDNYIDVDVKDLTTRYTNDVIASCAFGLNVDSHSDRDNRFYLMGKDAGTLKFIQSLKLLAYRSFPKILNKLNVTLLTENTRNFFKEIILRTIQDREKYGIIRPDLIHLLMEARKGNLLDDAKATADYDSGFATVEESVIGKRKVKKELTNDDIIGQAMIFFIAGFETVSTCMSFMLYELAINPEIQEKLAQEIKDTDSKNGGNLIYDSILQMRYLDMVVSEALRLWAPVVALDRCCVKDYNMGKPNDKATMDFIIRKGDGVQIPVYAFHRNPKFFPNPNKFDPERFSEKNKHKIKPFTYMPFGLGPRSCIGSRFALAEVKIMMYQLLKNVEVSPAEKTRVPGKISPSSIQVRMEGGHWLRLKNRN